MWNVISSNPDAVLTVLGLIGGWFGIKSWRTRVRESTAAEIDYWATTVASGLVLVAKGGFPRSHSEMMATAIDRFYVLARAAGVRVHPEHEQRALATIHNALIAAGQRAILSEAINLNMLAESAMERMAKLPWPKDAEQEPISERVTPVERPRR